MFKKLISSLTMLITVFSICSLSSMTVFAQDKYNGNLRVSVNPAKSDYNTPYKYTLGDTPVTGRVDVSGWTISAYGSGSDTTASIREVRAEIVRYENGFPMYRSSTVSTSGVNTKIGRTIDNQMEFRNLPNGHYYFKVFVKAGTNANMRNFDFYWDFWVRK